MRFLILLFRLFVTPQKRRRTSRQRSWPGKSPWVPRSRMDTDSRASTPIDPNSPPRGDCTTVPAPEAALVGRCYVIDGDTIDIGGVRIRLAGVDAPEMDQPFGNSAKWALVRLCKGQEVRAVFDGSRSHDRTVATCYLPDGRDLSEEMVKAGLAIDWPKFSGGRYRQYEPDGVRKKLWRCDARQKGRFPPSPRPNV